ncbi:hypothetical protein [Spirillospora sp. CA-128828]|uniref:hypothetical protein n=1 Tax=Spirillospora sp. CA-128828 TaxID=3240033 RepID=UPI003D930147
MTDRFRGQDPDNEFSSEDEYGSRDQMSSSMHDEPSFSMHDESAMQQEQGGRAEQPEGAFMPDDGDYSSDTEEDDAGTDW